MKLLLKSKQPSKALIRHLDALKRETGSEAYASIISPHLSPTTDVIVGDIIAWFEPVFSGNYRNAKLTGYRYYVGKVIRDSYGANTAQHTFTIAYRDARIRRKGRVLYANCFLLERTNDDESALNEKHERGRIAKIAALQEWLRENEPSHPRHAGKLARLRSLMNDTYEYNEVLKC